VLAAALAGLAHGRAMMLDSDCTADSPKGMTSLLAFIVDSSNDAIIGKTLEGVITSWNPAAEKMYGYAASEVIGQSVRILACPDRLWEMDQILARIRKGECIEHYETVRSSKHGRMIEVSLAVSPIRDGIGHLIGASSIARDITEKRIAEQQTMAVSDYVRSLIEASLDPLVTISSDGTITDVNEATTRVTGRTRHELLGTDFSDYFTEPERAREGYRRAFAEGYVTDYPLTIHRSDGRLTDVLYNASVYRDKAGSILGVFAAARDVTHRKRAEEALKKTQAQLEEAMDLARLVNWELDVDSGLFTFNDRFYALYGTTAEIEGGYKMPAEVYAERFVHPDERRLVAEEVEKSIRTTDRDYRAYLEHRIVRRDGEIRHVAVRYTINKDELGRTTTTHGANQDITERKRAEEAVYLASLYNRSLIEAALDPLVTIGPDGSITDVNEATVRVTGRSREELIGTDFATCFTDPEDARQGYQRVFAAGAVTDYPLTIRGADGALTDVLYNASLYRDEKGEVLGIFAAARDVTERKRTEEALRLTQLSVDRAADLIYWLNPDGGLVYVSDSTCRRHGYSREALLGMTIFDLDPTMSVGRWGEHWREIKKLGSLSFESVHQTTDGEVFPVEIIANWVECGGQEYNFAFAHDVSRRRRAEEALRESEKQLQQAQKMEAVGQLAGGIAHDFNNLLTVVIGSASLLLADMSPSDSRRKLVSDIKDTGERAANLTRQILAFSRRQVLRPQVLSLSDVVRGIESLLSRTLGEDIDLCFSLADLAPIEIDPAQMEQVLMNLVVNARDAMPDGGRLTIETANVTLEADYCLGHPWAEPGPYVMLAVSDTGCGMDEATMARVFEPFFTTKELGRGTGLGLSTVYGIVKQSGGNIAVYSRPNHGSTFNIYLPLARQVVRTPGHLDLEPKEARGGTEAIALVEDEAGVRELLAQVLTRAGYRVRAGGSWREIQAALEPDAFVPELLVTDFVLPGGVDGSAVAALLRERYANLPVLFMSGYTQKALVPGGGLDRHTEFLQKPFELGVLLHKVREMLDAAGGVPQDPSLSRPRAARPPTKKEAGEP
jgi:two-component system, cell cycle sensor histidine kinase and response regulator CckA